MANSLLFNEHSFEVAIKRAGRLKSPGGSAWTLDHVRVLHRYGGSDSEESEVAAFSRKVTAGQVPQSARPYLYGGPLRPFYKAPEPSTQVRPVSPPDGWVRIGAKATVQQAKPKLKQLFSGVQFGACQPGGGEKLIAAVRALLARNPDWIVLVQDASQGFQRISRKAIRAALIRHGLEALIPAMDALYGGEEYLSVRMADGSVQWVTRCTGVVQGDPLATVLYCIGVHDGILEAASVNVEDAESGMVAGYVDDNVIVGPVEWCIAASSKLDEGLQAVGGSTNRAKTRIFARENIAINLADFSHILPVNTAEWPAALGREGIVILGVPVGTPDFETRLCLSRVRENDALLRGIRKIRQTQLQLLLLRFCAVPRMSYMMRTVPLEHLHQALGQHDDNIWEVTQAICHLPDREAVREQSSWPLSGGGLGTTAALQVVHAAALGSLVDAIISQDMLPENVREAIRSSTEPGADTAMSRSTDNALAWAKVLLDTLQSADRRPISVVPIAYGELESCTHKLQARLTHMHGTRCLLKGLASADSISQARLRSVAGPGASAWIVAIPYDPRHKLSNAEMICNVHFRLGVSAVPQSLTCICGDFLTNAHALSCSRGGGTIHRHNLLRGVLQAMCLAGGHYSRVEPRGIVSALGPKEGGDLLIYGAAPGRRNLMVDVSVVNPCALSYVGAASVAPLAAAEARARTKDAHYKEACERDGIHFTPLPIEAFGAFGDQTVEFVRRMTHDVRSPPPGSRTTWACNRVAQYWVQSISVSLARGNANAFECLRNRSIEGLHRDFGTIPTAYPHRRGL